MSLSRFFGVQSMEIIGAPSLRVEYGETPIPYFEMWERQRQRHQEVVAGSAPPTLFLLEHTPVITVGREFRSEHLRVPVEILHAQGIEFVSVSRGGSVTYHGPGQMVAYPILPLAKYGLSVRGYVRTLEAVIVRLLASYGITASTIPGYTGVWVDGAKVSAIGVGVKRWVTYHGLALNVSASLPGFQYIIPCGIADKPITSMEELLGQAPPMRVLMEQFAELFTEMLQTRTVALRNTALP
jgi:lipoyl(octanoyl) transferase